MRTDSHSGHQGVGRGVGIAPWIPYLPKYLTPWIPYPQKGHGIRDLEGIWDQRYLIPWKEPGTRETLLPRRDMGPGTLKEPGTRDTLPPNPSITHKYSILFLIIMKDEESKVFKLVKANTALDFLKNNTSSA